MYCIQTVLAVYATWIRSHLICRHFCHDWFPRHVYRCSPWTNLFRPPTDHITWPFMIYTFYSPRDMKYINPGLAYSVFIMVYKEYRHTGISNLGSIKIKSILFFTKSDQTVPVLLFISYKFVKGFLAITFLLLLISSWDFHDVCQRFFISPAWSDKRQFFFP